MQTQAAQTAEGCGDMRGTLPACAPLANPYVPFQGQNPDRYTAGRALMKGTLFPGLDLPYRGTSGVEPRSADGMQSMQDLQARISPLPSLACTWIPTRTTRRPCSCSTSTSSSMKCCGSRRRTAAWRSRRWRPPRAAAIHGWTIHGPGTRKRRNKRCLYMKKAAVPRPHRKPEPAAGSCYNFPVWWSRWGAWRVSALSESALFHAVS